MNDYLDLSGEEIRNFRSRGEISAKEILLASEERIAMLNDNLKAIVSKSSPTALTEADQIDKTGDLSGLFGLPVAIKDLNDVQGLATTFGSPLFEDNVADEDDDVVASVRKNSGIIVGKNENYSR